MPPLIMIKHLVQINLKLPQYLPKEVKLALLEQCYHSTSSPMIK